MHLVSARGVVAGPSPSPSAMGVGALEVAEEGVEHDAALAVRANGVKRLVVVELETATNGGKVISGKRAGERRIVQRRRERW